MEHENDGDTNFDWCSWYSHQRIDTATGGLENKRTYGNHLNYSINKNQPEYWEESWRLKENCYHSNSHEKPLARADVKNSQKSNNDKI